MPRRSAVNIATYNWLQRAQVTNASARRKGVDTSVTAEGVKAAWERSKELCHWCKHSIQLGRRTNTIRLATIEHVIPFRCGGTNTDDNIEFACAKCNMER